MSSSTDTQSSPEYQALQANLANLNNQDIAAAVQQFSYPATTTWQKGGSSSDVEGYLWKSWNAAIAFAESTPDDQQDGIVRTIQDVQKQGELTREDGEVCRVWDAAVWTDLPVFGAAMREAWNTRPDSGQSTSWRNINAFAARLSSFSYKPDGPTDFSLFGIWSLRDSLESTAAASKDYASIAPATLEAAAMWMLYCAEKLLRESTSHGGRSFDGKVARAGDGYSDKDWTGLNTERWILWKENLQAIVVSGQLAELKDLLNQAVANMETAEQQTG